MLELLAMSLLGTCYINARIKEATEEKKVKEEERIQDIKIKVFCYAVRHKMLYNQVVDMLQSGKLTFNDIDLDKENTYGF